MKAALVLASLALLAVCAFASLPLESKQIVADYDAYAARAVELVEADNTTVFEKAALGYPLYKQCNQPWSNTALGTCSKTICQVGCAMSSSASLLSGRGVGYNPGQLNDWLKKNGGYANGCDIIWSAIDKLGKTKYQGMKTPSSDEMCNGLKNGQVYIANVRSGSHWVLVTGCRGGGVFDVNDSGYTSTTYNRGDMSRMAVYN